MAETFPTTLSGHFASCGPIYTLHYVCHGPACQVFGSLPGMMCSGPPTTSPGVVECFSDGFQADCAESTRLATAFNIEIGGTAGGRPDALVKWSQNVLVTPPCDEASVADDGVKLSLELVNGDVCPLAAGAAGSGGGWGKPESEVTLADFGSSTRNVTALPAATSSCAPNAADCGAGRAATPASEYSLTRCDDGYGGAVPTLDSATKAAEQPSQAPLSVNATTRHPSPAAPKEEPQISSASSRRPRFLAWAFFLAVFLVSHLPGTMANGGYAAHSPVHQPPTSIDGRRASSLASQDSTHISSGLKTFTASIVRYFEEQYPSNGAMSRVAEAALSGSCRAAKQKRAAAGDRWATEHGAVLGVLESCLTQVDSTTYDTKIPMESSEKLFLEFGEILICNRILAEMQLGKLEICE